LNEFIKYQSLGNDFILFDWRMHSQATIEGCIYNAQWKTTVVKLCDRHFGIGADGVLILKKIGSSIEMLIFNSDGSLAEICLNGMRCAAHYLYHLDPGNTIIQIRAGRQLISNYIEDGQIKTQIPEAVYEEAVTASTAEGVFAGHRISVGNPHFVIFQEKELSWLAKHGALIEQHPLFKHKTNVEFVWKKNDSCSNFCVLVYERGCGITLACSSGAAAIVKALRQLEMIQDEEVVRLDMLGGTLECMMLDGMVSLKGTASPVFSGKIEAIRLPNKILFAQLHESHL